MSFLYVATEMCEDTSDTCVQLFYGQARGKPEATALEEFDYDPGRGIVLVREMTYGDTLLAAEV